MRRIESQPPRVLRSPKAEPAAAAPQPAAVKPVVDSVETDEVQHLWLMTPANAGLPGQSIEVDGRAIPRYAPAPTAATGAGKLTEKLLLRTLVSNSALFLKEVKNTHPDEVAPWRREEAAAAAMKAPLPTKADGTPVRLGRCAVIRPGFGNIAPSAAQLFRAARMSDRVVLAYSNTTAPGEKGLRALEEYEGVPVPKELKGKLFAIGSAEPCLVSFLQSSDVLLEQLQQMHEQKAKLGLDPLEGMTLIGHSQGGLDATLTRKRLEEAGLTKAVERLVTIASPFRGAPVADRVMGLLTGTMGTLTDTDDGYKAVKQLDPEWTRPWFGKNEERLPDLTIAGAIGGTPKIVPKLMPPFFAIEDKNNIRPLMRVLATVVDAGDLLGLHVWDVIKRLRTSSPDDGFVPVASARYGHNFVELERPHDHMSIWEDYKAIDEVATRLQKLPQRAVAA